ncbi:TraA/ATP-dependent exoDNAse/relaxase [Arthrobacter sp. StoSoilA2]|uniref:MobF family relaxase n=1 Tax=Arthrobacter sp. StoSoilA2 TaxID=2830990 RepID=UPI001CC53F43|nr:MobF family relaxase [Arthrobacter sp. StoSoilA2]BCW35965.1 TraA/ATP-dependent exoDNAse/relaxase [Arthrobacter sp. StoSoilA2]
MTMSIARLSVQSGLKYLFKSTMLDDQSPAPSDTISYYVKTGTPQGRWIGSGLEGIDRAKGDVVTESDAEALFQNAEHPDTTTPLGRPYGEATIAQKPQGQTQARHAVAGFDLTFSVPKSVSALWALSPRQLQEDILKTHHQAVEATLNWLEDLVINTRAGRNGVAHLGTHGVIAAAFDHWESRAGDPQLHTHVVIANRVQRITDNAWATLDSRSLYKAVVAASEHYNGLLFDALGQNLGTEADIRSPALNTHHPSQQLTGVDDDLIREFSNRSRLIDIETDRLVHAWGTEHRSPPSATTIVKLRQQATLSTRNAKEGAPSPLHELSARWRNRSKLKGFEPETVVASTIQRSKHHPFHTRDFTTVWIVAVGLVTRQRVAAKRSTWNRWNLIAEAERVCAEIRCASAEDRNAMIDAVATSAEQHSVPINEYRYSLPASAGDDLRYTDRMVFEFHGSRLYTDEATLAFEDQILAARNDDGGPAVSAHVAMESLASYTTNGALELHEDQRAAAAEVLLSAHRLDALVGPAGTGKTTTLGAIKTAWEAEFGAGSVVGLAPAAASAEVLGSGLGMVAENVSKWLFESVGSGASHRAAAYFEAQSRIGSVVGSRGAFAAVLEQRIARLAAEQIQWLFKPHQLVIVDEASMVSTQQLAGIVRQAQDCDAKVLLVGDPGQLDSIDAGGVLGWLDRQGKAARLSSIWRFRNEWERSASLGLRDGDATVLGEYERRGRISHGRYLDMVDQAYSSWHADVLAGQRSVLIAPDNETVQMLNERAQADRVIQGVVDAEHTLALRDGLRAGSGDIIIARRNDRRLQDSQGAFVRNGTLLEVLDINAREGSLRARNRVTGAIVHLGCSFLQSSMELGYATTAHRSQGITADTAHTVVTPGRLTRELLYVSMTRGRDSNTAYVSENDPDEDEILDPATQTDWRGILAQVLAAEGAERTAHEVRAFEMAHADSLERLSREYDYLAQIAAGADLTRAIEDVSAGESNAFLTSPAWGAAVATWRRAIGVNRAGARRILTGAIQTDSTAQDPAAIVHSRLRRFIKEMPQVAIDPLTENLTTPRQDLKSALNQVRQRTYNRIEFVGRTALLDEPSWTAALFEKLGSNPDPLEAAILVREVAVYRDRWNVGNSPLPLGTAPSEYEWEQLSQWNELHRSLARVARLEAIGADTGPVNTPEPAGLINAGWQL